METTWWQATAPTVSATALTNLVNRSGFDKCAWTDAMDSHLLRAGETWMISQVQAPGNVGVANVVPSDPTCANAKRDFGGAQR